LASFELAPFDFASLRSGRTGRVPARPSGRTGRVPAPPAGWTGRDPAHPL